MKIFLCLLLSCVGVFGASPSFSSFAPTQFATNNLIITIKDGAVMTNINNISAIYLNGTNIVNLFAPAGGGSGDSLWRDVGGYATLTNTMQGIDVAHDSSAGDDPNIDFDLYATVDGTFADFGNFYAIATTNSVLTSWTATSGNVLNTSLVIDITNNGGIIELQRAGSTVDGFKVVTPSGYTGAGTLFLSDDGTYKPSGAVAGDSIWTNITGYVTLNGFQTTTNTLAFTSGASNNATNIALRVDTSTPWSSSGARHLQFNNGGNEYGWIFNNGDSSYFTFLDPLATTNIGFAQLISGNGASGSSVWTLSSSADNFTQFDGTGQFYSDGNGNSKVTLTSTVDSYTTQYQTEIASSSSGPYVQIKENNSGYIYTFLNPTVASSGTAVAYKFDTSQYLNTSGDLLAEFGNAGTNQHTINTSGSVGIGSHSGTLSDTDTIISIRRPDLGDSTGQRLFMDVRNFAGDDFRSFADIAVSGSQTGTSYLDLFSSDLNGLNNEVFIIAKADGTNNKLAITVNDEDRTVLNPTVASSGSAIAYKFDTSNTLTNGDKLVSIGNAGVEQSSFSSSGGLAIGPSTESFYGLAENGTSLVSANVVNNGDPVSNSWFLTTSLTSNGQDSSGYFSVDTYTNRIVTSFLVPTNNVTSGWSWQTDVDGQKKVLMEGSVDGQAQLAFDATVPQIIWGPGASNVLLRSGANLVYTNGNSEVAFKVIGNAGVNGQLQLTTGGHMLLLAGTGSDLYLGANNNGSGDYRAISTDFSPTTNGGRDLGAQTQQWNNLYLDNRIVWNGNTNTVFDTVGTGSPEGVVAASPGSTYRNFSGGSLTTFWVKESGTGNTGWIGK